MELASRQIWCKVVGMLQHNWAVIVDTEADGHVCIVFFSDRSESFDDMPYESSGAAERALLQNGFTVFDGSDLERFVRRPSSPLTVGAHPNGRIYSSGKHWLA